MAGSRATVESGKPMPSKSAKQHNFMAMCSNSMGRQNKRMSDKPCPPMKVAKEYVQADKGRKFKK